MPKQRKVFAMRNFLGLDKENKALKVAPFRASDGYNFQIDSQTLKTREGFVIDSYIEADLATTDYVIDWYEYKGATLYVTKESFYVVYGTTTYNLKTNTTTFVKTSNISQIDHTGLRPIFKEEKNALFIFGLNAVYVFTIFFSGSSLETIVLYDLKDKPTNPFSAASGSTPEDINFSPYEELPKPYEPTLFIGDAAFDDVNLLSNVSKYKLFAKEAEESEFATYTLPTHFDEEKHGSIEDVEDNISLTFYDGKFDGIDIYPVYLGVSGEDFTYASGTHGAIENSTDVVIAETFFPEEPFEHYHHTQNSVDTYIKQRYGLTRDKFFRFNVKDTNQNVFEFLLNYIKDTIDTSSFTANKVVRFDLPYKATNIEKKESDTTQVIGTETLEGVVHIYVQLKKFYDTQKSSTNANINFSSSEPVFGASTSYPSYPSQTGTQTQTFTMQNALESNTSDLDSFAIQHFNEIADREKEALADTNTLLIQGKFFFDTRETTQANVNVLNNKVAVSELSQNTPPAYPDFDYGNTDTLPIDDFTTDFIYPFNEALVSQKLKDFILNNKMGDSNLTSNSGEAFVKYQIIGRDGLLVIAQSRIAKIFYQKEVTEGEITKISASTVVTISSSGPQVSTALSNIRFNKEKSFFELDIRDFFFDYNLEPSIEVKVTFSLNPDYELITKNKFGVLFGSEDRLFLAGHPDYPNIDRYNVSNDLLGDNVVNQSYELSYFPSKNYRVLGGKGAINGYVVATDTQLYITKSEYSNDSRLFIRERFLDEKGLAGYKEFKTNILESPLNDRCLVRFYNDILLLTKNGLYGVEISSNVLTNERLLKLRSGFINKHLKSIIASETIDDIYIVENNQMMYIFIGLDVFIADSRYISKNENSEIENLSYELIQWKTKEKYFAAKFKDNVLYVVGKNKEVKLKLVESTDEDFVSDYVDNVFTTANFSGVTGFTDNYLQLASPHASSTYTNFSKSSIFITQANNATLIMAKITDDYTFASLSNGVATFNIVNQTGQNENKRFAKLKIGDVIHFIKSDGTRFGTNTIKTISTSGTFTIETTLSSGELGTSTNIQSIGVDVSKKDLYPVIAIKDGSNYYFRYAFYKSETVYKFESSQTTELQQQLANIYDHLEIIFHPVAASDGIISIREPIVFLWQSSMTDFGNNLMEKTMYRANIYATKQETSNSLFFGYKTMRRFKNAETTNSIKVLDFDINTSIANQFDLNDLGFTLFSINSFEESGMSFPLKENNFLYIQFLVKASGRVELNAIEAIYKDNRTLKSIG